MKKNILLSALMLGIMLSPHRALSMDYAKQTAGYYGKLALDAGRYAASGLGQYVPDGVKNLGPWASNSLSNLNRNHALALFVAVAGYFGLKILYDTMGNPIKVEPKEEEPRQKFNETPIEYSPPSNAVVTPKRTRKELVKQEFEKQYGPIDQPEQNAPLATTGLSENTPVLSVPVTAIFKQREFQQTFDAQDLLTLGLRANADSASGQIPVLPTQVPLDSQKKDQQYTIMIKNEYGAPVIYQTSKTCDPNHRGNELKIDEEAVFGLVQLNPKNTDVIIKHPVMKYDLEGFCLRSSGIGSQKGLRQLTNLANDFNTWKQQILYRLSATKKGITNILITIKPNEAPKEGIASLLYEPVSTITQPWNIDFKIKPE